MIGVVTAGTPLFLIISLCEYGSLQSQLKKRKMGEGALTGRKQKHNVDIALDIARGMQHLVEHHLIHRDLAARNVLLDADLNAKVADFGLSRNVSDDSEYYKSAAGVFALRWTASSQNTITQLLLGFPRKSRY